LLAIAEGAGKHGRRVFCLHFASGSTILSRRTQRLMWLAQKSHELPAGYSAFDSWSQVALCAFGLALAAAWLPANVLASPRSNWSPWPAWTAAALHGAGITVRDHEVYDRRTRLQELQERVP
jgi:hypothetical protein